MTRQRNRAQNRNQDQHRCHLKRQQQLSEKHAAQVFRGVMPSLSAATPRPCACRIDRGEHGKNHDDGRKANDLAARLPSVRSSRPAFSSMTTNVNSTMMAPE